MAADVANGAITLQLMEEGATSSEDDLVQHADDLDLTWGSRERRGLLGSGLLKGVRATLSRVNV